MLENRYHWAKRRNIYGETNCLNKRCKNTKLTQYGLPITCFQYCQKDGAESVLQYFMTTQKYYQVKRFQRHLLAIIEIKGLEAPNTICWLYG